MKTGLVFLLALMAMQAIIPGSSSASLKLGYYKYKCKGAEKIIRQTMANFIRYNPTVAPSIIRMHFHDCFVRVSIYKHIQILAYIYIY